MLVKLLHTQYARRLVVVVEVEAGGVELAALQDDEHVIVGVELAKVLAAAVVIESLHIVVEPHLAAAKG